MDPMDLQAAEQEVLQLVEELNSGSSEARKIALQKLDALEVDHPAILPALINALKDPDVAVRLALARELERRGDPAIAALIERLREARGLAREAILNVFVLIGPPAKAAIPILSALRDDPLVGALAQRALHSIRHGKPMDWRKLFNSLTVSIVLGGVVLALLCEFVSWLGVLAHEKSLAYQISISWLAIGAYFGAVIGMRVTGGMGMHTWAKFLGMACATAGAVIGRLLGQALEPLVQILGQ